LALSAGPNRWKVFLLPFYFVGGCIEFSPADRIQGPRIAAAKAHAHADTRKSIALAT